MLVDINLLPQKEQERPVMLFAILGVVTIAILIWLTFFMMAQSQKSSQAEAEAEKAQLALQSAEIQTQLDAAVGISDEQQLKMTVDWAEVYQFDTLPLLDDLVKRLPERGYLENFSYIEPNLATLNIQFDSSREAAYYLTQLKDSELITSVVLESVTNKELMEVDEEAGDTQSEEEVIETPRYVAIYSLAYQDERFPEEILDENGEVIDGADSAETVETGEVQVEETEAIPEESEGDAQ